jgi:hypothetical protein
MKEDLVKLCEHLKQQNQKLQVQSLAVADLNDYELVPASFIPGGTSTFGGNKQDEVFNPYKTDLNSGHSNQ